MARLMEVGRVPLYYNEDTGELQVDPEDVENAAVGEDVYGDDDVDGDDEYGDDDVDGDDDDDEDEVGDDAYAVGDDEVGGKRRRKRVARRKGRRAARKAGRRMGSSNGHWEQHVRAGEQTPGSGTAIDFTIANNSDFRCGDMSFEGSDSGAKVSQIWFGDDPVFNPGSGVATSMFGPTSTLRGSLKGKLCPSGSTIRVQGTIATAGDTLSATFLGQRFVKKSC